MIDIKKLDQMVKYDIDETVETAFDNNKVFVIDAKYEKRKNRLSISAYNEVDQKILRVSIENPEITQSSGNTFTLVGSFIRDISVKRFVSIYNNKVFQLNTLTLLSEDHKTSIKIEVGDGQNEN